MPEVTENTFDTGDDVRHVDSPTYDPRAALDECYDLWASGAWPDANALANLEEVMCHVGRLLGHEPETPSN